VLDIQRIFKQEGFVEKETPYDKMIDESFAREAAKALGPHAVLNKESKLHGCR